MNIKYLAATLAMGVAGVGSADTVAVNFDEALTLAYQSDARISEKKKLVAAADALLEQVQAARGVIVDVNAALAVTTGHDGGLFESGQPVSNSSVRDDVYDLSDGLSPWLVVQATLIKPIATFGRISGFRKAARGNVTIKEQDVRITRSKVTMDVAKAYFGFLTARDNRRLLDDIKKKLNGALELAEDALDDPAGKVSQGDVFSLKAGIGLVNKLHSQAQAYEDIALDGLKVLVGLNPTDTLKTKDSRLRTLPLPERSVDDYVQFALENRPEIKQLEGGLKSLRGIVQTKEAEAYPIVFVGVRAQLSYAPDREALNNPFIFDPFNHAAATPLVGLQWKWDPQSHAQRVIQAQSELESVIEKQRFALRGIPFQVREAYRLTEALYYGSKQMRNAAVAARRAMTAHAVAFEAGTGEPAKLLEALRTYALLYSDYLTTVNDYNMQVMTLKTVSGELR